MPPPRRPARKASPCAATPRDKAPGRRFDDATPADPARETQAAETLAEIAALSRAPFRRILSRYVQATPDMEALAAQADQYPDRWAQGLAIAGRLAGYTEKLEIEGSVDIHHLHRLSDLELLAELADLEARLSAFGHVPRSLPPGPPPTP